MSQAVWVKSGTANTTTDEPLFPYDNFGVWGIARNSQISTTYNLWNNTFTEVNRKITDTGERTNQFIPNGDEYWIYGYTYDFLALAPFDAIPNSISVVPANAQNNALGKDYMTFTYDLSAKYAAGTNNFDLLGAAVKQKVETGGYSTNQPLMFWHLFSQINISTSFGTGLNGESINGEVTAIHLYDIVTAGDYTISLGTGNGIDVICTPSSATDAKTDLTFSGSTACFNIIPQNVKTVGLYLDFKISEGTPDSWTYYSGLKVNLNVAANQDSYTYNGKYNWIITIGTGAAIKFDVAVTPWETIDDTSEIPM